jgi:hypothetical protein
MCTDSIIIIIVTKRTVVEDPPGIWGASNKDHEVYRVGTVFSTDNFEYFKTQQNYNFGAYLYQVFKDSPVFFSEEKAKEHAKTLNAEISPYVIDLEDIIFFGDR